MLRAAICDDDTGILERLSEIIRQYQKLRSQKIVFKTFDSSAELRNEIDLGEKFDILFLDIIMPDMDGMMMAKQIRQYDSRIKIIFLTSTAEFALQSYLVKAYSYQQKPIDAEKIFALLDQIIAEYALEKDEIFVIKCTDGITRLKVSQLEYCESVHRKLYYHLAGGCKVLKGQGKLDELSELLKPIGYFMRPHRSFLVNMDFICSIEGNFVIMSDQKTIPIPHGKYTAVKNEYLRYLAER